METENEFIAVEIQDVINEICPECLSTGVKHIHTQMRAAYCEHKLCGYFAPAEQPFKVVKGIERHVFRELLARTCTVAELKLDVARGVAGIVQQQANDSTKH